MKKLFERFNRWRVRRHVAKAIRHTHRAMILLPGGFYASPGGIPVTFDGLEEIEIRLRCVRHILEL